MKVECFNPTIMGSKIISILTEIGQIFFEIPKEGYVFIIEKGGVSLDKVQEYFSPKIEDKKNKLFCKCSICGGKLLLGCAVFGLLTKTPFGCCICVDILQNEFPDEICIGEGSINVNITLMGDKIFVFYLAWMIAFFIGILTIFGAVLVFFSVFSVGYILVKKRFSDYPKKITMKEQAKCCLSCTSEKSKGCLMKSAVENSVFFLVKRGLITEPIFEKFFIKKSFSKISIECNFILTYYNLLGGKEEYEYELPAPTRKEYISYIVWRWLRELLYLIDLVNWLCD